MKEKILNSIDEFNKYRAPEAKANLISFDNLVIRVEFTGPFCMSCGFYDYFDDLRIIFEEMGLKTEITLIEETEEGAIVDFKLKNT
ncbi:MAG: hypothetical protein QXO01_02180 [Nitrososphaerota archaeon]